jgi:DNA-binding MarR family transcriptional regulator
METVDHSHGTEMISFRRQLRALEREVIRELDSQTGCCGVTLAQCHALLELAPATLSLTGLAEVLGLDRSTLSRTVDSLVKAGLVERTEDLSDRRSLRLALTAAGAEKVAYIDDSCNRYYDELLEGMSHEDRTHVLRGVAILAERMRNRRHVGPGACCPDDAADGGRDR